MRSQTACAFVCTVPLRELRFGFGDLFCQLPVDFSLRRKQRPGKFRDGVIDRDPIEKFLDPTDTLGSNNAKFGRVTANGICHLRPHSDQAFAHSDQHQSCLLFRCLYWHESHRRPTHRLTNGLRICGIVLSALDVRFNQLRRDQFDIMAIGGQQPRQVVGRPTGFERHPGRRHFLEVHHHIRSPQLFAQHRLLGGVHAVKLKDVL